MRGIGRVELPLLPLDKPAVESESMTFGGVLSESMHHSVQATLIVIERSLKRGLLRDGLVSGRSEALSCTCAPKRPYAPGSGDLSDSKFLP